MVESEQEKTSATSDELAQVAEQLSDKQRGFVWNVMDFMVNTNRFGDDAENFVNGAIARVRGWFGAKKEGDQEVIEAGRKITEPTGECSRDTATTQEIVSYAMQLTESQRGFVWNMMDFMVNSNSFYDNAENFVDELANRVRSWFKKGKETA